jgi:hypothetical protein
MSRLSVLLHALPIAMYLAGSATCTAHRLLQQVPLRILPLRQEKITFVVASTDNTSITLIPNFGRSHTVKDTTIECAVT